LKAEIDVERGRVLFEESTDNSNPLAVIRVDDALAHAAGSHRSSPGMLCPTIADLRRSAPSTTRGPGREVYALPSRIQTGVLLRNRRPSAASSAASSARARGTSKPQSITTTRSGRSAASDVQSDTTE